MRKLGAATLAALLLLSASALGQNNSLLHAQRRAQVPTSQPAGGMPIAPGDGIGVRGATEATAVTDEPVANEVLLAVSPIAIDPPKPRKFEVNDLVTVIVRESRQSLNDAKYKSEKDWEIKWELAKWLRLDPEDRLIPQTFPNGTPGIDSSFEDTYEGKGKYDRKDELTTRITATIIDVKPNGNLVLEARKLVKTGDETMAATLIGECRSEDVTAQNTVLSTQLADLEIDIPDRGSVRDATRRGWLKRVFDFLRPF